MESTRILSANFGDVTLSERFVAEAEATWPGETRTLFPSWEDGVADRWEMRPNWEIPVVEAVDRLLCVRPEVNHIGSLSELELH